MGVEKTDLSKLREILHSAIVEVEVAMDTGTHPDWSRYERQSIEGDRDRAQARARSHLVGAVTKQEVRSG